MKKVFNFIIGFGILFLFFIQMAGTLVSSIYILDLMHTSLDAKVLGVLFFFSPILLLPFGRKTPAALVWVICILLFLSRSVTPYLDTMGRMLASGIGTGSALSLIALSLVAKGKADSSRQGGLLASAGLALGVGLSVLLRSLNYSVDYSLVPAGGWVGVLLGLVLVWQMAQLDWTREPARGGKRGLTSSILGIIFVLTLVYFAFSAPAVISRWTEGNYPIIVIAVSLLAALSIWLTLTSTQLLERISPKGLFAWNLAFTLSLTGTILVHRVAFPLTAQSPAVVVESPSWLQHIPLVLILLLFPVIFVDLRLFVDRIRNLDPSPRDLVPGFLLGGFCLVLLVFMNIFTNVWGYVAPVSTIFRNLYWLPFLLITAGMSLVAVGRKTSSLGNAPILKKLPWSCVVLLGLILAGSGFGVVRAAPHQAVDTERNSLLVMTYNLQAGNDSFGEQSYDRQLAIIRGVQPDILALQESDTARISLNNIDLVRYFADQLGYYSYFGPSTVTGTFGTAILSKYPLEKTHTIFTFSDQDEVGTAEAQIVVGGRILSIYDVHPDGSDTAKQLFAQTLLDRSVDKAYVIALGDYNLRDYEAAYQAIDAVYTNSWVSVYPSKIGRDGIDMSGDNRIDHIFISTSLGARNPVYVLAPDSATDHPVHWTEIFWED
jgi:endonuclease/exonuclease/phosphatase family metal-dependent hydrolase